MVTVATRNAAAVGLGTILPSRSRAGCAAAGLSVRQVRLQVETIPHISKLGCT
jgi:hypothetical protein